MAWAICAAVAGALCFAVAAALQQHEASAAPATGVAGWRLLATWYGVALSGVLIVSGIGYLAGSPPRDPPLAQSTRSPSSGKGARKCQLTMRGSGF